MTVYFFHLRRGQILIEDWEGGEFATVEDASDEAIRAAKELVIISIRSGQFIDGDLIEIWSTEHGKVDEVRLRDVIPFRPPTPEQD